MKNLKPILLLSLAFIFMGCDLVEELIEEEFDETITFDGELEILEESAVSSTEDSINVETQLGYYSIANDPDIASLIEDDNAEITKIKIDEIRYTYKDFEGNEEAVVVSAGFLMVGNMESKSSSLENGIAVADADQRNLLFTHRDDFNIIESALLNGPYPTIGIQYFGTLSRNPVYFKVAIRVQVTVTIKAKI